MSKKYKWVCDQVKLKFHKLEDNDFKNLLAEVWEILLPSSGQFKLCPQPIAVEPQNRLSKLQKRTRR